MKYIFVQFAATEAAATKPDLLSSIGIDWKLLLLQTIAFLLLLWLLRRFVYPPLVAMLDRREQQIAESVKAATEAEKNAVEAEAKTTALIKKARKDADELLASAKAEATELVSTAERKSRDRAEQIMTQAETEIARSIEQAKRELRTEAVSLVSDATEKVLGKAVDATIDTKIVRTALEEVDAA